MSTPIREQIIQALATRVGAVRELEMYDERDLPITVISADEETAAEGRYGLTNVTMNVGIARAIAIEGTKDDTWHTALSTQLADLIVEIYTGGDDLGGLADGIDYVSGSTDLLTDGGVGAGVAVTVQVRYTFVHGDPYSQDADAAFSDV